MQAPVSLNAKRTKRATAVKFTQSKVTALQPRSQRYQVADADTRGLVVRVFPSGSKAYYATGTLGSGRGAPRRNIKIGDVTQVSLHDARSSAKQLTASLARGMDPNAESPEVITIAKLIELYSKRLEARGIVKHKVVTRTLEVKLARIASLKADTVTRRQFVMILEGLEAIGQEGSATNLRAHIVAMLNWAVSAGHINANTMAGYRREKQTRHQRNQPARLTFTTRQQIKAFWDATEQTLNPSNRDLMRMMLLTGQRRTETASMRWADVEGDAWSIPASVAKTGVEHRVTLGPTSQALIHSQPKLAGTPYIFPSKKGGVRSGWSQMARPIKEAVDPRFSFHALRRTYRTGLDHLGIREAVAELMIGHARPDLIARYARSDLWQHRIEAQAKWEQFIGEVVA